MKKFETYLKQQQGSLDLDQTDEELLWTKIEGRLHGKNNYKKKFVWWRAAAVIILLLSFSYVTFDKIASSGDNLKQQMFSESGFIRQDLYQQEISQKWQVVNRSEMVIEDFPWLKKELSQLDEIHLEYLNDLEMLGERPEILRALQKHYELKIKLLDRLIIEIDKKKNNEKIKENHAKLI
jgi:hypothetical protein